MKVKENKKMPGSAVAFNWFEMFETDDDLLPDFGTCASIENALKFIRDFIVSDFKSDETFN